VAQSGLQPEESTMLLPGFATLDPGYQPLGLHGQSAAFQDLMPPAR